MTTFQKIDSSDNLVPNGSFCEGVAYWEEDPSVEFRSMQHMKFFADHEGQSPLSPGEPKYGLFSSKTAWCWLNRNDFFTYPIKQYRSGFVAVPIDSSRLIVSKVRVDDFKTEAVDWATTYDATLGVDGVLSIVIEKSVLIPMGTLVAWMPPSGTSIMLVIDSEGPPEADYRTFTAHKANSTPITSADVGDGISTINFWVKKIVEKGSTVVLEDYVDTASGYYTVEDPTEDEITLFKQGATLELKAKTGDVEGIVYEYDMLSTPSTMKLRVFGSLTALGVTTNDYFVMKHPYKAYGRISSISTLPSGIEEVYVTLLKTPPDTGSGVFVAATEWVISPKVDCDLEVQIPGVQYELTLAFTHPTVIPPNYWHTVWWVYLDFVTEEGASVDQRRVIESIQADNVTSFVVATGSTFTRRIMKIVATRPLPIPGVPRLRFFKSPTAGTDLKISDVALLRGNFAGTEKNESLPADYDELMYTGSPDGGLIPKGTVVPYIGGRNCPPGWREVVGHPGDTSEQPDPTDPSKTNGIPPGPVEFEFPKDPSRNDWFSYNVHSYNPETDITTVRFDSSKLPAGMPVWDLSKDGYSYYPWSSYKVYMPIVMRPPPRPPVYRFKIRINGYTRTLFSIRLPAPPSRPQRYEYVEVGMLKPKVPSALILQIVKNAKTADGVFETRQYPYAPDAVYNAMIADIRIMTEFTAYETGSSADTENSPATYPDSYNSLYNEFNIDNAAPTPDGITTLIRLLNELYTQIKKIVLYDPRRLGQPLPSVRVKRSTETNPPLITEIDLIGDWTMALDYLWGTGGSTNYGPKARIICGGYAKIDSNSPGLTGLGSEQHNHSVSKSDLSPIVGAAVKITGMDAGSTDRPPVPANHGHGYLGAGGYSRPFARTVKFCEKL